MFESAAGVTQRTHGRGLSGRCASRSWPRLLCASRTKPDRRLACGDGQDQLVPRVVEWWSSAAAARVVESTGCDGGEGWAGGPRVVATSGAPIHPPSALCERQFWLERAPKLSVQAQIRRRL
eukprot:scaffold106759_cov63-Phaeocystis_antarctica.AAC.2